MRDASFVVRHAETDDFRPIYTVMNDWWGGRDVRHMLHPFLFTHFRDTTLVIEKDGERVAFLLGFLSQTYPDQAYCHFIGVHPDYRKEGLGRFLYERFFEAARSHGRTIVRAVTSSANTDSIAFHSRMGFEVEHGAGVTFTKRL